MNYLARREYSASELAVKLKPFASNLATLQSLIADLSQQGLLSDARFAEQFVQVKKRKFGAERLAFDLRGKGVDESLITSHLQAIASEELTNARAVWQKKFKRAPSNREDWARQARFLQGRGFSLDIIKQVLSQHDTDEPTEAPST